MKFTVVQRDLALALSRIAPVAMSRGIIPILEANLFKAGDTLQIMTTNLDIWATAECEANIEAPGCYALRGVLSIIKGFPKEAEITFDFADGFCAINCGRSRYRLPTLPGEEFPVVKPVEAESFECAEIVEAMARVVHACATGEVFPERSGVALEIRGDFIDVMATDGNRGGCISLPYSGPAFENCIIPRALVNCASGAQSMAIDGARLSASAPGLKIVGKLVQGKFPPVRDKIIDRPPDVGRRVIIHAKPMAEAIDRLANITDEKYRSVELGVATDKVTLSFRGQSQGSEDLPACYSGDDFSITVNSTFLKSAIMSLGTDEVELLFGEKSQSAHHALGQAGHVNFFAGLVA